MIIILEALLFDERFGGLEDLGALCELKCKGMNIAYDLALHRDPSHRDPSRVAQVDSEKAHERRVLWWALMSIDGLYSGPICRRSSINGLEAVDVFLPALSGVASLTDVHEGCENGCTASSPVMGVKPRLLISYVGHEVSKKLYDLSLFGHSDEHLTRLLGCLYGAVQCPLSTMCFKQIAI